MLHVNLTAKKLGGLITPGAWLLLAAWAALRVEPLMTAAAPYLQLIGYGTVIAAALLGWFYDRGRAMYPAIVLGLAVWGPSQFGSAGELIRLCAIFLVPLNFVLFAWLEERGVVTPSGLVRFGIIGVQGLAAILLGELGGEELVAYLQAGGVPGPWTWMSWTLVGSFGAGIFLLLLLWLLRTTKIEAGLIWTLGAFFLAMNGTDSPDATLVYTGAAGLILLVSVLEHGYDVAYLDELTGLPGRRALNEQMKKLSGTFAIAMCDVDHFKKFNDTYGHDVGDQVLRMVASRLMRVKGGGRPFRYGGEEFTVVFTGRRVDDATSYLEGLRASVADSKFILRGDDRPVEKPQSGEDEQPPAPKGRAARPSVQITISIGVADSTGRASTPEQVVDAADEALYKAKEGGRNCVKTA